MNPHGGWEASWGGGGGGPGPSRRQQETLTLVIASNATAADQANPSIVFPPQGAGLHSGKAGGCGAVPQLPPPLKRSLPDGGGPVRPECPGGSAGKNVGKSDVFSGKGGEKSGPVGGKGGCVGGKDAGGKKAMIPCPKCERVFAARAHLDRHMPVHS